jgi:hypothetical protein
MRTFLAQSFSTGCHLAFLNNLFRVEGASRNETKREIPACLSAEMEQDDDDELLFLVGKKIKEQKKSGIAKLHRLYY